jgi:hypothetical protein
MGNYHPASKRLFQDPSEKSTKRSRERGLRLGVGSFGGGMLRLSKREIEMYKVARRATGCKVEDTIKDETPENIQVTGTNLRVQTSGQLRRSGKQQGFGIFTRGLDTCNQTASRSVSDDESPSRGASSLASPEGSSFDFGGIPLS